MGLFSFLKSSAQKQPSPVANYSPYKDSAVNVIYNLLFCDNPELYTANAQPPFSGSATISDLQKIIDDTNTDPRIKILAYNKQLAMGHKPGSKELLAVIVEVGLDEGLDVLASFNNGTARYINQTGKVIIWETADDPTANELTRDLFLKSQVIVQQIGPWDKPRKPHPAKGNTRITFLVSDGLYFGEAPTDVLFNDQLAAPALASAAQLMQYLIEKTLEKKH